MRALAATGRTAEALAAYERLRTTPRRHPRHRPLPRPARRSPARCCARRSRAGPAPHRPPPGSLRAGLTSFLGRRRDRAASSRVLGRSRLATVVGPGGAGKTRLATEVGRAVAGRPRGRRVARRARAGPRRERRPAGVPRGPRPARGDRPRAHPRGAARHRRPLAPGRDAERRAVTCSSSTTASTCSTPPPGWSRTLLATCPELRGPGHQPGAAGRRRRVALRPVRRSALPRCDVGLDEAMSYASVQLFVDRAAAVRPGSRSSTRRRWRRSSRSAAARRSAAGHRAGRGADPGAAGREVARRLDRPVPAADRRPSHRAAPPPDAPGGRRVELGPAHRRTSGCWPNGSPSSPPGRRTESATAVCADDRLDAADVPGLLGSLVDKSLLTGRTSRTGCATGCWRRSASSGSTGWPSAATSTRRDCGTRRSSPTSSRSSHDGSTTSNSSTPQGFSTSSTTTSSRPSATSATPRTRRARCGWCSS